MDIIYGREILDHALVAGKDGGKEDREGRIFHAVYINVTVKLSAAVNYYSFHYVYQGPSSAELIPSIDFAWAPSTRKEDNNGRTNIKIAYDFEGINIITYKVKNVKSFAKIFLQKNVRNFNIIIMQFAPIYSI